MEQVSKVKVMMVVLVVVLVVEMVTLMVQVEALEIHPL
jgi:hypothetical protein